MKIQVTQENLNKALNHVARVASGRNTLPILSNVLIKTVNNRVCVAATNLNIAITHYIGSKVTSKGAITVPARLTQDFVSSLPPGVVNLNLEDNKLHIQTEKYNSTINCTPAEDYPIMPAIKNPQEWKIPANTLKKTLTQTVTSASNDDSRPILTGVYMHSQDNTLKVVATDSYRLTESRIEKVKQKINLLIPSTAVNDLLRILPETNDMVTVFYDEQQVKFVAGDTELITRLIDGSYPEYQKLIPSSFVNQATLLRSDFINITKVSSLFARESAGSITIELDPKGKISIKAIASQLGENTAEADASVKGDGKITLNSRYLLDALGNIDEEKVTLSFNGKLEPCVINPETETGQTHVIMPLKS